MHRVCIATAYIPDRIQAKLFPDYEWGCPVTQRRILYERLGLFQGTASASLVYSSDWYLAT